jgi:hypothetical protein
MGRGLPDDALLAYKSLTYKSMHSEVWHSNVWKHGLACISDAA